MNGSRIKKIRKEAKRMLFGSNTNPYLRKLTPDLAEIYLKTIKTMKKARVRQSFIASIPDGDSLSKKMHAGESLANFRNRRKVCNGKRREREINV